MNGIQEKLITTGSGWEYKSTNGDTELYDASGKLISITKRNGLVESLIYSDVNTPINIAPQPDLLIEVQDEFNRSIFLTYDANAKLISMQDPDGNEYWFSYNNMGLLSKITYPSNGSFPSEREYLYESTNSREFFLLTGIIDENGDRYATYTYNGDAKIFSSEHAGSAGRKEFHYNSRYYNRVHTLTGYDENGSPQYRRDLIGHDDIQGVSKVVSVGINDCAFCQYDNKLTTYDAQTGLVASTESHEGDLAYFEHDNHGRQTCKLEGLNLTSSKSAPRATHTTWDVNFNVPTVIRIYAPVNGGASQSSCSDAISEWTLIKETTNFYDSQGRLESSTVESF